MNETDFEKKYPELYQMIGGSFAADADYGEFDIDYTLKRVFNPLGLQRYKEKILPQAREVLAMEPFPEELIIELSNQWSPDETAKQWLTEVVEKLEKLVQEAEAGNGSH